MMTDTLMVDDAGVEGGFQVDDKKFVFEEELSVVLLPQWYQITFPNIDLPEEVRCLLAWFLCWFFPGCFMV